jgi:uncharacterized membrane protein
MESVITGLLVGLGTSITISFDGTERGWFEYAKIFLVASLVACIVNYVLGFSAVKALIPLTGVISLSKTKNTKTGGRRKTKVIDTDSVLSDSSHGTEYTAKVPDF